MALQVLFTVFALFAAVLCSVCAYVARESAQRAAHSEHRLSIMRGQVAGLEAALMGLDAKHQKLAGRVYADEFWRGKRLNQPDLALDGVDAAADAALTCENWKRAQLEGPMSPAAKCECAYCENRREVRAQRRASMRTGVKS